MTTHPPIPLMLMVESCLVQTVLYNDRDGLTDESGHGTSVVSVLIGDKDNDRAADRLPLDEQGQQPNDSTEPNGNGDPSAESSDDQALTGSNAGAPLWIPVTITAAALLTAAVILTLILILRKKRHRTSPPHSTSNQPHPPPGLRTTM